MCGVRAARGWVLACLSECGERTMCAPHVGHYLYEYCGTRRSARTLLSLLVFGVVAARILHKTKIHARTYVQMYVFVHMVTCALM